ncbi:hypothetical protein Hanom_Chr07g00626911 [Helianthus anomalus]
MCGAKKIVISPPKSYHDWKGKFFYIHEEVIPISMEFREHVPVSKEDMKVPKGVAWYEGLRALSNQAFSESVLVAASLSDKWPHDSEEVLVLLMEDADTLLPTEVELYHLAFLAYAGVMVARALGDGEEY